MFVQWYIVQVDAYLGSKLKTIDSLLPCPTLATAFMKINSTLPSSAAVERLFSAAAQVLTVRRCRMSDETLDQHIFLRSKFTATRE